MRREHVDFAVFVLDLLAQTVQESGDVKTLLSFAQILSEDQLTGFPGLSVFQQRTTFLTMYVEF